MFKNKTSTSPNLNATQSYILKDFYLKDLKYISPDMLRKEKKINSSGKENTETLNFKRQSLMTIWLREVSRGLKQFLYEGSLHGVKYMFEPTFTRTQRMIWVITVAISIAFCCVHITQLFSKWTSTPFVNVLDSIPSPIWAVPFPTVVLCPHLHVKLSFANVSELEDLEKFFASLVCPNMDGKNVYRRRSLSKDENRRLEEFIHMGAPKCADVVKSCYWRDANETKWMTEDCCERLISPIFTNYGLCFAFNSLPLNGMTNDTVLWHKTFNNYSKPLSLEWGLDSGYPKVFPPDPNINPFRVMASGEVNGLSLELYLNGSEHQYACDGNSVGFNLLIASPTDHVYTSTIIRLPMDRFTAIEVTPTTYKTDSTLRILKPEKRQCFFQDERELEYFAFYTDSNCKYDKRITETQNECRCVKFNWPRKNISEPICATTSDYACIDRVAAKVEENLIFAYYDNSEEQSLPTGPTTSCHPSCNDILYSCQVFYSDLTGESFPQSGQYQQGEVTRINVHFYDDIFLGQHRHAQYDDYYFVGAVGGLLSLFLGFSIISVAELVYFVILRPLLILWNTYYYTHNKL